MYVVLILCLKDQALQTYYGAKTPNLWILYPSNITHRYVIFFEAVYSLFAKSSIKRYNSPPIFCAYPSVNNTLDFASMSIFGVSTKLLFDSGIFGSTSCQQRDPYRNPIANVITLHLIPIILVQPTAVGPNQEITKTILQYGRNDTGGEAVVRGEVLELD